eukprot:SAG11_NODE_2333_length_3504_cov_54.934508_3_plen_237_part_00
MGAGSRSAAARPAFLSLALPSSRSLALSPFSFFPPPLSLFLHACSACLPITPPAVAAAAARRRRVQLAAGRRLAPPRRCPAPSRTLPHGMRSRPLASPPPFLCRRAAGRGRGAAALRSYLGLPRGEAWGWAAAEQSRLSLQRRRRGRAVKTVKSVRLIVFLFFFVLFIGGGGGGHRRLTTEESHTAADICCTALRHVAHGAYVIPRCFDACVYHRGITYGRGHMLHRPEMLRTARI